MPDKEQAQETRKLIESKNSWSKQEIERVAEERTDEVARELKGAFNFLANYPKSVTFFGSTMAREGDPYYESAKTLASRIAKELEYAVLTGGGPGIMEAANRGAFESGGKSLGLTIELKNKQITNKYLTSQLDFYYFFVRKVCLSFSAEAFIFYPGGYGTLDEFFELLTLVQTKKIEGVPLICVGPEYWNKVKDLMKNGMLNTNFILSEDLDLFTITDDLDQVVDIIKNVPVRISLPFNGTSEEVVVTA